MIFGYWSEAHILIAVAISFCRVCGFKSQAYQAIAHLFVGYILGTYIMTDQYISRDIFWILCLVEIVCFLIDRLVKPKEQSSADVKTGIRE